jgi:SAM-dependent methyltransferase
MLSKDPAAGTPLKALEALEKLVSAYEFRTVLDIGCGPGRHSQCLRAAGKEVTGIDYVQMREDVIVADYLNHEFAEPFDCLWASHVLEHQLNVHAFLRKLFRDLKPGGILAITVPPLKHAIVGGHVTLWNAGLLLYNLVLAGFDCQEARVKHYGYNISVLVPKVAAAVPYDQLHFCRHDMKLLARFFPRHPKMKWEHAFRGDIVQLNWDGEELHFDESRPKGLRKFFSRGYWRRKPAA